MCLVAIPLLILVAVIFFMIASIDGALFGTPDDEVNGIIQKKMKEIMQNVADENGGQVGMRLGDNFQSVQLGLKLIPSMDQHDFLLKRMQLVGGNETHYTGMETNVEYDMEALGDTSLYPQFFEWNGARSLAFPKFYFDKEHVPLGNSVSYCLGLTWTTNRKRNQYDKYLDVRGQEYCRGFLSKRQQWEADYPERGLNFHIWNQKAVKGDSTCSNGMYMEATDMCYTYQVMKQVCIMVKFSRDADKNTYSWVYTGGCYKDNKAVYYEDASPNDVENFKNVQFEVRHDQRDFSAISEQLKSENESADDEESNEAFDDEDIST